MRYENEFQLRSCNFKEGTVVLTADVVSVHDNKVEYDRDMIDMHWPEILSKGVEFGDSFRVTIERIKP